MKRLKYSLVLGLSTSIFLTLYISYKGKYNFNVTLFTAVFMFIFITLISYFKMFAHINNKEINFQELKNIIYSGRANHYLNGITVGGNLYLTDNQLIFQTNILNFIQKHECIINLKDIALIEFEKTLGMVNNGLLIRTENGLKEKFVVTNREQWKNEIEKKQKIGL
ncbi:GRAM domain-containing protein [Flavobacterium tyrosinilyticum]|uniref:GRAM domain-containing protein n=1 Tax=Flavobacterium tyrosinilyticum TaxID=1658740 RepID=UPI00202FF153|nr:GRAM domain-containing protein [Flavobacterium tyrosinilyticum]MCM0667896.1 GRAM domain-containing protein [Flavobacterium tyrosinilyticum]